MTPRAGISVFWNSADTCRPDASAAKSARMGVRSALILVEGLGRRRMPRVSIERGVELLRTYGIEPLLWTFPTATSADFVRASCEYAAHMARDLGISRLVVDAERHGADDWNQAEADVAFDAVTMHGVECAFSPVPRRHWDRVHLSPRAPIYLQVYQTVRGGPKDLDAAAAPWQGHKAVIPCIGTHMDSGGACAVFRDLEVAAGLADEAAIWTLATTSEDEIQEIARAAERWPQWCERAPRSAFGAGQ